MVEMVDNSILEAVALCDTKAVMQYKFGLVSDGGKVKANIGKAIHHAHESYFTDWNADNALAIFNSAYDRLVTEQECADMEANDPCVKANVEQILAQYYRIRPPSYFPFTPIVEGIEKVHKVPLMDGVEFFGLIDLPVRENATGALMPCDHKNRFGYINEWWTKAFGIKSQFSGYVWVLQRMFDEPVSGIYVNALAIQKLPNATTTRCRVHKVPYNQCRMEHVTAKLFVMSRGHEMLVQWEADAKALAAKWLRLKNACQGPEMVKYMGMQGAFSGGCTFCDYKKFCRSGRSERLIDGLFVESHWRPWEDRQ